METEKGTSEKLQIFDTAGSVSSYSFSYVILLTKMESCPHYVAVLGDCSFYSGLTILPHVGMFSIRQKNENTMYVIRVE